MATYLKENRYICKTLTINKQNDMERTRFTHILLALAVATCAWAQGPNGSGTYYQNANGQKGEALKTTLSKIISTGAKNLGYKALWDAYKTTDLRPDGTIWGHLLEHNQIRPRNRPSGEL